MPEHRISGSSQIGLIVPKGMICEVTSQQVKFQDRLIKTTTAPTSNQQSQTFERIHGQKRLLRKSSSSQLSSDLEKKSLNDAKDRYPDSGNFVVTAIYQSDDPRVPMQFKDSSNQRCGFDVPTGQSTRYEIRKN